MPCRRLLRATVGKWKADNITVLSYMRNRFNSLRILPVGCESIHLSAIYSVGYVSRYYGKFEVSDLVVEEPENPEFCTHLSINQFFEDMNPICFIYCHAMIRQTQLPGFH